MYKTCCFLQCLNAFSELRILLFYLYPSKNSIGNSFLQCWLYSIFNQFPMWLKRKNPMSNGLLIPFLLVLQVRKENYVNSTSTINHIISFIAVIVFKVLNEDIHVESDCMFSMVQIIWNNDIWFMDTYWKRSYCVKHVNVTKGMLVLHCKLQVNSSMQNQFPRILPYQQDNLSPEKLLVHRFDV